MIETDDHTSRRGYGGPPGSGDAPRPVLAATMLRLVVAAAIVAAAWALSDVLLLLFFAVLLSCVLRGSTNAVVARIGGRDGFVLATFVLATAVLVAWIIYWIVPELVREGTDLVGHMSLEWQQLRRQLGLPAASGAGSPLPACISRAAGWSRISKRYSVHRRICSPQWS